ncbi:MAG: RiPP maturation radical SAM C-methyltransferase [Lachnospiraceae bacterium]|nr:RiPP maturation radical SAM C-methyltransferase [Lachnospiraceae bacterium]
MIPEIKKADVCLVMPPVSFGCMPSLALGILKACLKSSGISCYVDYANMYFSNALSDQAFASIYHGSLHGFFGEYIFNEAAGIENGYSMDDFIGFQLGDKDNITEHLYMENVLRYAVRIAGEETGKTVERLLARNPKVVGCTAVFEQRNAALAILRRIKEKRPDIITFMGGFTCFDNAGIAMLKEFPFLDYVFCGESDDIFAEVCGKMIDGTLSELPFGLIKQGGPYPDDPPHRIVQDLDAIPIPDYDDYMEMLHSWFGFDQYHLFRKRAEMRLVLETSRGCWWGDKHPCLFCGLNGQSKCYRKKSAAKVLDEIRQVTEKYENRHICFADNIMPNEWFKEVIPSLKEAKEKYYFTVEVKANIREEQVRELKEAGYAILQPGMESMSDHVLKLLDKGVTGIQNIALLKYAAKYDMIILWNILTGTVGETTEDYRIHRELIPLIEHLQPPKNCSDIIYMRNSVYCNEQDKYGLKLKPDPVFKFVSPDDEEYVKQIAFHYIDENRKDDPFIVLDKIGLNRAVDQWRKKWGNGSHLVRLDSFDEDGVLYFTDTRSISTQRNGSLSGILRDVFLAATHPVSVQQILTSFKREKKQYAAGQVQEALNNLCGQKLMVFLSGKYLALTVEITKEKSMELSYREFFGRMMTDPELRDRMEEESEKRCGKDKRQNELIADMGSEYGYIFDADTIKRVNLIPEKDEMDILK